MARDRTGQSFEYKFKNPYTGKEESFDYELTIDNLAEAIEIYADFYNVSLDGTSGHIIQLFASLDSGHYEHINEVLENIVENEYVIQHLYDKLKPASQEEYEEQAQEEYEAGMYDD